VKILILSDNFVPEIAAPSFRVYDHAKVWIAQGHDVTVVTGVPNWPHGRVFDGYQNRWYQQEWVDGIRVIRLWTYMTANKGFLKRTLDYVSFMLSAILFCWRYPKFDVLLATSPQFFTAVAGWAISLLRRRPWVFEVRDLWPASIKAVGVSQGRLITWLERLELFLYRRANRILALTRPFKHDLVQRGIDPDKIDVVTNGVDAQKFARARLADDARHELGVPRDAFLAGYIGTTGLAHGLETVVRAADRCRDHRQIQLLVMGEGAQRQQLEADAAALQLDNVHFRDRVPHADVPRYYAALDVAIVHLKPQPVFRTVIPSKIFELMAMEVPILMAIEGEAARIVTEAGCGVCIPSGDPHVLAETVLRLAADPQALREMGQRGRAVAIEQFDRTELANAALGAIRDAIRPRLAAISPIRPAHEPAAEIVSPRPAGTRAQPAEWEPPRRAA
jgi:glycosyltransferase involved in cell wall biosynthesis